jgi:hypothetical protein
MFYDKTTGQLIDGTPEEIQKKVMSGEAVVKKGTKAVNVVDSEGNAAGSTDLKNLPELFKQGFRVETPREKLENDYVDENKGIVGAGKVLLRSALDSAFLGIPSTIADKAQDPLEVSKRKKLAKEHEAADLIGSGLGIAATFVNPVTGGATIAGKLGLPAAKLFQAGSKVGKATEKFVADKLTQTVGAGVASKIAPKVVGMAAEGATIMAPQAITEAMLGDPGTAAESLMAGGALGGVFGLATGVAAPAFSKMSKFAKSKIDDLPKLKEVHEDAALNAIGTSPAKKVQLKNDYGDVVDKLPAYMDEISRGDRKILVDPKRLGQKIQEVEELAGAELGNVVKELDDKVVNLYSQADDAGKALIKSEMFDTSKLVSNIKDKYIRPIEWDKGAATEIRELNKVVGTIEDFVNTKLAGDPQALSVSKIRELYDYLGSKLPKNAYGTEGALQNEAIKSARGEIQNYFKNLSPKLVEANPDLATFADRFKKAAENYRISTSVKDIAQKYGERVDGKQMLGLLETTAGIGTAVATGNPLGLIAGIAGRKVYDYAKGWYNVGGLLLTEEAIAHTAKSLDGIKKSLLNITDKKAVKGNFISKVSQITGNKDDDDYDKLSQKLQSFVDVPQNNQFNQVLDQVGESGAPMIADTVKLKSAEAVSYLLSVMPKPLTPNNPLVKSKGYKPSDMEMAKFSRQVKVALDPLSVVQDLNDNTLTSDQVEVLANVYPQLLEEIRYRVTDAVAENPTEVPYNKRIKLSLLLGLDLDPSLNPQTAAIIMAPGITEDQQQPAAQNVNPNAKFVTYPTQSQRLENNLK